MAGLLAIWTMVLALYLLLTAIERCDRSLGSLAAIPVSVSCGLFATLIQLCSMGTK